jgi:hypothetical protein
MTMQIRHVAIKKQGLARLQQVMKTHQINIQKWNQLL